MVGRSAGGVTDGEVVGREYSKFFPEIAWFLLIFLLYAHIYAPPFSAATYARAQRWFYMNELTSSCNQTHIYSGDS